MKSMRAAALAFAAAGVLASGPAAPSAAEPSGTTGNSISGMKRGMPAHARGDSLGRERPLLSLALHYQAELGLSAEQVKTLRALVDRFGKEASDRMRDIEAAERDLADLLKQEPADFAQIEGKVRAVEKVRADLRLVRIRTIAEGRAALTPEQRARLDQLAAGQGR